MAPAELPLSRDQVDRFAADGFLAIERIASADEVLRLRALYDAVLADPSGLTLTYRGARDDGSPGIITQVFSPEWKRPELLETEYLANARRLAAALLQVDDRDVAYGGLMFIHKPAGEGRDTPWHQDEAYWAELSALRCHSLSVWMPLDDVTVESGCMQYVPRSHVGDVRAHVKPPGAEPLRLREPVDPDTAVPCEIPAGGATVHYCRTIHYGGANVSTVPRRAMTTIFHGPGSARPVPLEKPWLAGGAVWADAR
ncbi:MAG TPA: phytanoyl-CoA dioxygenase family protein [Myxococcota bacterium]|nr:phytanoyl-CoA dioxygenase family protein [Myxococcota bacterium]